MGKMKDLSGQRFGKLTVISKTDARSGGSVVWLCKCDCGNEARVASSNLSSGNTKSCGCLQRQGYPRGFNDLYSVSRGSAKRRHLEFSLSKEQYYEIVSAPCSYCGAASSNTHTHRERDIHGDLKVYGTFAYNGIDRVDSSKGYTPANCVSSCKRCNVAKNDMSMEEFKEWLSRIYAYLMMRKI